jgi:hypothetical protein
MDLIMVCVCRDCHWCRAVVAIVGSNLHQRLPRADPSSQPSASVLPASNPANWHHLMPLCAACVYATGDQPGPAAAASQLSASVLPVDHRHAALHTPRRRRAEQQATKGSLLCGDTRWASSSMHQQQPRTHRVVGTYMTHKQLLVPTAVLHRLHTSSGCSRP